MNGLINYPHTKKQSKVSFRLNSDDFSSEAIRRLGAWLKSKGYKYKYYRTYSDTKLMSWGIYHVSMDRFIDWDENERLAKIFIEQALS